MDRKGLITALNGDLANEYQAIIAYTRWSAEMIGDETTHYEAVKLLLDGWSDSV